MLSHGTFSIISWFTFYLFFNFFTFAVVYPSGCPSILPSFFLPEKMKILEYSTDQRNHEEGRHLLVK